MIWQKVLKAATPAKAVPPAAEWIPAPRFRGDKFRDDENGMKRNFYEAIILGTNKSWHIFTAERFVRSRGRYYLKSVMNLTGS
jgi:hypothetical protein